ncbi:MAG TPA: PAS domain-containing protein [Acidimicrobiia bacterium]
MPPHQQPVEIILLRQVASYLSIPVWVMDSDGNLVYYNDSAESLLGIRFDDVGPIHADQLREMFRVTDLQGAPISESSVPVVVALSKRVPAHGEIRFCGMDGVWRDIEVSAIPLEGQGGRFLGVLATFWEIGD